MKLSVFPANRGVLRPAERLGETKISEAFSIPCESWGSATTGFNPLTAGKFTTFSIPCESWGSATPQAAQRG